MLMIPIQLLQARSTRPYLLPGSTDVEDLISDPAQLAHLKHHHIDRPLEPSRINSHIFFSAEDRFPHSTRMKSVRRLRMVPRRWALYARAPGPEQFQGPIILQRHDTSCPPASSPKQAGLRCRTSRAAGREQFKFWRIWSGRIIACSRRIPFVLSCPPAIIDWCTVCTSMEPASRRMLHCCGLPLLWYVTIMCI